MGTFPETLVICICTHGIVPTNIENKLSIPIKNKLKYPINLFKINAVTYGIPFMSDIDNIESICNNLKNTIDKLNLSVITPEQVSGIIKKKCLIENKVNTQNIIGYTNISEQFNLYANYCHEMFKIIQTKQNEEYIEKIFVSSINEVWPLSEDNDYTEYCNKIKLLNLDNIDLFSMLKAIGNDFQQISLSDLIELLFNMTQMKNLIILDFSCSKTEDDKRSDRRLRREFINEGLY
jgi:hypothetical protein